MSILHIEFLDGTILDLEIDQCGDQAGMFHWRGDANQARRLGYVAVRNGIALALNGDAGEGVDRYLLSAIRKLTELP